MFLALMFVFLNFISMPVWAGQGDVAIDATNFPDATFRGYVLTEFDTNNDGILSQAELDVVTDIDVSNKDIADLKGIECFKKLNRLYCRNNQLTALDLSHNTALTKLYCQKNKLTSPDLTANTNITEFNGVDQEYDIEVDKNTLTFDLTSLPGHFNPSKASAWAGGSVSGTTLTLDPSKPNQVTYTYNAGNGKNLSVTLNVTYTVVPTPTKYTVSFDKNGGSDTMAAVTVNKDSTYNLPTCTFTPPVGKEFKAWQVGSEEKNVGDSIIVNGDTTVKAVWKDTGSNSPFPPFPPRPPKPYNPYPWTYPGYWHNEVVSFKPKEDKKVSNVEIEWKLVLSIGKVELEREINGVESNIKMDIAPYIKDGRTMLLIRFVAEALGFDVDWDKSTRTVILKQDKTRVEIPVDTNQIIVNSDVYTSDVKPEIKNNRTMLPIANIARALGLQDGKDIIWDSYSRTVTIYRSSLVK